MFVLVVEDDEDYAEIISFTLKRDNHEVAIVDNEAAALKLAAHRPPDLAVLDVMLGSESGLQVCARLRELLPTIAVLFLSSLDRSSDIIAGLDAGGDDYLTKPFSPGELIARVRAIGRRVRIDPQAGHHREGEKVAAHGLEVDFGKQIALYHGASLDCTPIEAEILGQLVRYPGQPLSYGFLTQQVWGYDNVDDPVLLKGHISSIRRKLKAVGGRDDMVRTVYGVGYSFSPA
ncbi:MAG: response regulator transcription factor [Dehalococcoidia bacterium]